MSCWIRLDGLATTSNCKCESVQQTTARIRVDVGRRQLEHRCPLRMRRIVLSLPLCAVPPRPAPLVKGHSLRQVEARRQHQPTSWPFCPPPVFPRQSSKLPRPFQLIDELDRPPSPSPSPSPFWPSTDPSPIHPPILIFCPSLNLRPPSHPASEHHLDAGCSRFALPIAISTALWRPETYSPISNLIESESYLLGISPATRSATVLQL